MNRRILDALTVAAAVAAVLLGFAILVTVAVDVHTGRSLYHATQGVTR